MQKQSREPSLREQERTPVGTLRFCFSPPGDEDGQGVGISKLLPLRNPDYVFPSLLWWSCSVWKWGSLCPSQTYTFSLSNWIAPFSYTLLMYKSKIFLCVQLTIAFLQTNFINRLCCTPARVINMPPFFLHLYCMQAVLASDVGLCVFSTALGVNTLKEVFTWSTRLICAWTVKPPPHLLSSMGVIDLPRRKNASETASFIVFTWKIVWFAARSRNNERNWSMVDLGGILYSPKELWNLSSVMVLKFICEK